MSKKPLEIDMCAGTQTRDSQGEILDIAGADISQFTHLKTKKEAFDLIRQAQWVLDKLEALPYPTLAMIKGFCLGGGLELALACRYRIAADTADTNRAGVV